MVIMKSGEKESSLMSAAGCGGHVSGHLHVPLFGETPLGSHFIYMYIYMTPQLP